MADDAAATGLGRRRREAAPTGDAAATGLGARRQEAPPAEPPASSGSPDATRLGERRRSSVPDEAGGPGGVVRFGPGVPPVEAGTPTSPAWGAGRTPRRRRRSRGWVGGLLTLLIAAGVVAWLLTRQSTPLEVRGVQVAANPAVASCGATVDVVGTVTTDGHGGTFRYQWTRSDGQTSDVLSQTVPRDSTSTQVHLQWAVSGRGRFDGRATLRVLDPGPMEGQGGFSYACP